MANKTIKKVSKVAKSLLATALVAGTVLTGTSCAHRKNDQVQEPNQDNINSSIQTPSTEKPRPETIIPAVTKEDCLNFIDSYVAKHFDIGSCEVQSIKTQVEDTGALSVHNHYNYMSKEAFEGVSFVIQAKVSEVNKTFTLTMPIPTNIYFSDDFECLRLASL